MIVINKKIGESMSALIKRARLEHGLPEDAKLTFAGRLDPLAEGVVLLLEEVEIPRKEEFLNLPKTYQFELLLGITTDSHDPLGVVIDIHTLSEEKCVEVKETIKNIIQGLIGTHTFSYPNFSSKTVGGIPLWTKAREARGSQNAPLKAPERPMRIDTLKEVSNTTYSTQELLSAVMELVGAVEGDFMQTEVIESWNMALQGHENIAWYSYMFLMTCGSGTYVRTICDEIGKRLGCGGIALRINRIAIGDYK
jgi:tRNA pseudouridine55 synthase